MSIRDNEQEKKELEEAYRQYQRDMRELRSEIRDRIKELVEDEAAREGERITAEFGRKLGLSSLTVTERQGILKTRDWSKYKRFMDAAKLPTRARTAPAPEPEQSDPEDYQVTVRPAPTVTEVPYPFEVTPDASGRKGTKVWVDLSHSPVSGEHQVGVIGRLTPEESLSEYILNVGEDAYREFQQKVLAEIPKEELQRYDEENGLA